MDGMCPYLEVGFQRINPVTVRSSGWSLTQYNWCPYKKGKFFGHRDTQREDNIKRHVKKMDIFRSERPGADVPFTRTQKEPMLVTHRFQSSSH